MTKSCFQCKKNIWHIESNHVLQPPKYLILIVDRFRYTNNNVTKIGVPYLWIWPLCLVSIDLALGGHIHLFTLHTTITATSLMSRMASLVASSNVFWLALYCICISLYYLLEIKVLQLLSCGLPYIMYILWILVIMLHLPTVVKETQYNVKTTKLLSMKGLRTLNYTFWARTWGMGVQSLPWRWHILSPLLKARWGISI